MKKYIAIINPEDFGLDLSRQAKIMGYHVIACLIEKNERYEKLKSIYCFEESIYPDVYDERLQVENWEAIIPLLKNFNVCAVIAGSEIAVDCADLIGSELNLVVNQPATILSRRNKFIMKKAVKNANLAHSRGEVFSELQDAIAFINNEINYPVVIKPIAGSGGKNVFICNNENDLAIKFFKVLKHQDAYLRESTQVLVEEFIEGEEYAVNLFKVPGQKVIVTDIWKYHKIDNNYANCIYYNDILQDLNQPQFAELKTYAQKVYDAVGIDLGPAHAEIKLNKNGACLIEVGSRLAGGNMPKYVAQVSNFDPFEKTIEVFLGQKPVLPEKIIIHEFIASADISHERFGFITEFSGVQEIKKLPSYEDETWYSKIGDYIEPTKDVDHLLALFWFKHSSYEQVENDLKQAHQLFSAKVKNDRILVVGTTCDYIDFLNKEYANKLLFLTDTDLRKKATEKNPRATDELLGNLDKYDLVYEKLKYHLEAYRQKISGIVCFDCESLLLTSFLAKRFNLAFPNEATIENCRSKTKTAEHLKKAKIPCANFAEISTLDEALSFFRPTSEKKCVIKPINGAGSELTFLCDSKEQITSAWSQINSGLQKRRENGLYSEQFGGSKKVIIQEFIHGEEFSADFVITEKQVTILRVCKKHLNKNLGFGITEAYELLPVENWPAKPEWLGNLFQSASAALGELSNTVVMVDFIRTKKDFYILEITPRPGGDCLPFLIKCATGISTLDLAMEFAVGNFANLQTLPVTESTIALRIFTGLSGELEYQGGQALTENIKVLEVSLYRQLGHIIAQPPEDYFSRILGHIIYSPDKQPVAEQNKTLLRDFNYKVSSGYQLPEEHIKKLVNEHLQKKNHYLQLWEENGKKPAWIFDKKQLQQQAQQFQQAFSSHLPNCDFYYAMKANNLPEISQAIIAEGFGLDVSSGNELNAAINLGCKNIIFSGPGKTQAELELALENANSVTMLIDSFGELERLQKLATAKKIAIKAGVRIIPPNGWGKFGIPLEKLKKFFETALQYPFIQLQGIQFHASWNCESSAQVTAIEAISSELKKWSLALLSQIRFLDIGGGYWNEEGEWLLSPHNNQNFHQNRIWKPAISIEQFASDLTKTIKKAIFPLLPLCKIQFEPGRWIVHNALHLLLSVIDKKGEQLVITDAGTNAIGWERFETDYFPIINLTNPAKDEKECNIYGSLCTPHDIFGYGYWGTKIEVDDVLLIPNQGAYTYSLQQNFIKPLPQIIVVSSTLLK